MFKWIELNCSSSNVGTIFNNPFNDSNGIFDPEFDSVGVEELKKIVSYSRS